MKRRRVVHSLLAMIVILLSVSSPPPARSRWEWERCVISSAGTTGVMRTGSTGITTRKGGGGGRGGRGGSGWQRRLVRRAAALPVRRAAGAGRRVSHGRSPVCSSGPATARPCRAWPRGQPLAGAGTVEHRRAGHRHGGRPGRATPSTPGRLPAACGVAPDGGVTFTARGLPPSRRSRIGAPAISSSAERRTPVPVQETQAAGV